MKKIVLLLLALSLVAGQALFAQDDGLKITGFVKTGVRIQASNYDQLVYDNATDKQAAANQFVYKNDQLHNAQVDEWNADESSRTKLRLNFAYEKDNFAAYGRIDSTTDAGVGLGYAYGKFSFLENMVEVSAGYLDNNVWGTFNDFWLDTNMDTKHLVKIEVKPIEGLSLGINFFNVKGKFFNGITHDADMEFKNVLAQTVYGVGYTTEDFGARLEVVGFNAFNDIWLKKFGTRYTISNLQTIAAATGNPLSVPVASEWDFGSLLSAYYYGVDNLKVDLNAYLALDTTEDAATEKDWKSSAFGIGVRGMYTVNESLKAGARVDFANATATVDGHGASYWQLGITPMATYVLNELITLDVEIPLYFVDNWSGKGDYKDVVKDYLEWKGGFDLGFKPKATFNLANGCSFVTFYQLNLYWAGHATKDPSGGMMSFVEKDPQAYAIHQLQFDFIWSF